MVQNLVVGSRDVLRLRPMATSAAMVALVAAGGLACDGTRLDPTQGLPKANPEITWTVGAACPLARFEANVAVAVTGIAGPGGGTQEKPIGTVWVAWQRRGHEARVEAFHFGGDRDAVRRQTVAVALEGVRKILTP